MSETPPSDEPTDNREMLTLLEFSVTSIISLVCPIFLIRLFFVAKKRRTSRLSVQLIIHLIVWLVFMVTVLFYALPIVLLWRGPSTEYNTFYGRATGALNFAAMMITPLSTAFLAIDRIVILAAPTFPVPQRRMLIQIPSALTILFCYVDTAYLSFTRSRSPWPEAHCLVFACYMPRFSITDLMTTKFVLSLLNVFMGCIFVYLYFKHNRSIAARHERRKNYIVLTTIINETVFSVFPTCIYMMCDMFNMQYASRFGPFMTFGHGLDILITTFMFHRTWVIKVNYVGQVRFVMKMTPANSSATEDHGHTIQESNSHATRKY